MASTWTTVCLKPSRVSWLGLLMSWHSSFLFLARPTRLGRTAVNYNQHHPIQLLGRRVQLYRHDLILRSNDNLPPSLVLAVFGVAVLDGGPGRHLGEQTAKIVAGYGLHQRASVCMVTLDGSRLEGKHKWVVKCYV